MPQEALLKLAVANQQAFYNHKGWRRFSKSLIAKRHFACERCKDKGRYRAAECVHHKKTLKERPDLALDPNNLMALCHDCHNEVHNHFTEGQKAKFTAPELW